MFNNTHDGWDTVLNIFCLYLRDLLRKFWGIYSKCSNSVHFWARKMFLFFKWVRISPEIDWYHYQGASPATTCIVHSPALNIGKDPYGLSVTSKPSVGGGGQLKTLIQRTFLFLVLLPPSSTSFWVVLHCSSPLVIDLVRLKKKKNKLGLSWAKLSSNWN